MAASVLLPFCARSQDELFLLRPQPFQSTYAAVAAGEFKFLDGLDAELGIEQRHGLWAYALEMQQVENRRRKQLEQLLVITRLACFRDLANLRRKVFADAGNSAQLLFGEVCELVGGVRDRLRRVSVRANLERIVTFDFEQIGDLGEDARNGQIVHMREQEFNLLSKLLSVYSQAVGFNPVVKYASAAGRQGMSDGSNIVGIDKTKEAAAASSAAHLRRAGAGGKCAGHQRVDHPRRHSRSELFARVPLEIDLRRDTRPVAARQRLTHTACGLDNALKTVVDVAIAIDVTLRDFPVVRAGKVGCAGVGEHDS